MKVVGSLHFDFDIKVCDPKDKASFLPAGWLI